MKQLSMKKFFAYSVLLILVGFLIGFLSGVFLISYLGPIVVNQQGIQENINASTVNQTVVPSNTTKVNPTIANTTIVNNTSKNTTNRILPAKR